MGGFRGHACSSQDAAGGRDGGHSVPEGVTAEGSEGAEERVPSMISTPVRYDVASRQQNLPAPHGTDCAEYAPYILYTVPLSDSHVEHRP